jgi:hypothetical protein
MEDERKGKDYVDGPDVTRHQQIFHQMLTVCLKSCNLAFWDVIT